MMQFDKILIEEGNYYVVNSANNIAVSQNGKWTYPIVIWANDQEIVDVFNHGISSGWFTARPATEREKLLMFCVYDTSEHKIAELKALEILQEMFDSES